jgi:F-type H+-transporting ATPase subunit epsilon
MADGRTSLLLEVVTPQHLLVHEEVTEMMAPGQEGYFGVLPGHTPLLAALKIGELIFWKGREEHHVAVSGGYAEVRPDRVTILADAAERAEAIDVQRAEAARRRADERLRAWGDEQTDFARAQAAVQRALMRLDVAGKGK